ncbi:MAG TPA: DivIVA domain-containing protein [Rugosimonospora sp.]|nr:DivIVA domain-containing protein [Rugosimonospora sp.]
MTSQGQRFRRRALRRGYKVDEVDSFLDRVEATLNGEGIGAPVSAQEVHDVVFRVRFGGYDEWQVDLHLDRVERQLSELEERGGFGRPDQRAIPVGDRMGPADRMPMDRMGPPERMGPPDRVGLADRMGPPTERMYAERPGPPARDDRMAPPVRDDRMMPPSREERQMPPARAPMPSPAYGRYDEPTLPPRGYEESAPRGYEEPPSRGYEEPAQNSRYDAFEQGRHGKTDMTTELRMPPDMGSGGGPSAPTSGVGIGASGEVARIDQLRRTFQPRRFGSGYDPGQVDRLFEGIMAAMSGRSPVQINDAELDPGQFNLVPGGYFEAEVDQALREVRDIIRRR